MSDVKLTVEWEQRAGQKRVKHVRLYASCYRAQTEGDVTVILSEREADALLSDYVDQLREKPCLNCGGTDDDHISNYYCPAYRPK